MTTTSTGAPAQAGASGRSGARKPKTATNGKGKHVNFRGLDLLLAPDNEVGSVVFTINEDELSETLKIIIGPEQYLKVRDKCAEDKLTIAQVVVALRDLLGDCLSKYEVDLGE